MIRLYAVVKFNDFADSPVKAYLGEEAARLACERLNAAEPGAEPYEVRPLAVPDGEVEFPAVLDWGRFVPGSD